MPEDVYSPNFRELLLGEVLKYFLRNFIQLREGAFSRVTLIVSDRCTPRLGETR
jgi:hypothetical protein